MSILKLLTFNENLNLLHENFINLKQNLEWFSDKILHKNPKPLMKKKHKIQLNIEINLVSLSWNFFDIFLDYVYFY